MDNDKRIEGNISEFAKQMNDRVGTGMNSYDRYGTRQMTYSEETYEEIMEIIISGDPSRLSELSVKFFNKSGLYQRIVTYFSNYLTYDVFTTPQKVGIKQIKANRYLENYKQAVFFNDTAMRPKLNFSHVTYKILVEGAYYGIFLQSNTSDTVLKDLPARYCRSRFKTHQSTNVLEFDMEYFDSITDEEFRKQALEEFPKEFKKAYAQYKRDSQKYRWFFVPPEYGIAFFYLDQVKPFFISMIPAIALLEQYKMLERDLDSQELERILTNEIPMDKDGNYKFSLAEAKELHQGLVNMVANIPNVDVVTSLTKLNLLSVSDKGRTNRDNLEKIERSVYNEAGVSKLLFAGESATALKASLDNDMSLVLDIAEQYGEWLKYQCNLRFSEPEKYYQSVKILPISQYNRSDMLEHYLKAAGFGYSKLLVGIASGVKQSELLDLIEMENDILGLHEKMIPLQSSHTGGGNIDKQPGRPAKDLEDREDKTVENQEGM